MSNTSNSTPTATSSTGSQPDVGAPPEGITSSSSPIISSTSSTSASTSTSSPTPSSVNGAGTPQSSPCGGVPGPSGCALSAGGIAGVSIACAVLGAALALLISILLMRRRQWQSNLKARRAHSRRLLHKSLRAEKPSKALPPGAFGPAADPQLLNNIESLLPQQADDNTVKQKILILFDQIEIHVTNYYGEYEKKPSATQEGEISRYGTPCLAAPLAGLLERSHRKLTLIKHCLGFYVVKHMSSPAAMDSLLPSDAIAVMAVPAGQNQRNLSDQSYSLALSRWRMLTAYLRPDIFDGSSLQDPDYDSHIEELATRFSRAFDPFSNPQYDDQRVQHLKDVFRTAARLALWLQSQPSTFNFDWGLGVSPGPPQAVVTVPAVMKSHDQDGAALNPPLSIQPIVMEGI